MAWNVNGQNLTMAEGDYGLILPVTISGVTFSDNDEVKLTIKDSMNGETILSKVFANIVDNTFNFEIAEDETDLMPVGTYVYSLDWYQAGAFMCNIIPSAHIKVVDKA